MGTCVCVFVFSWGMIVARWCRKSAQKWASVFVFDARLFFARLVNEHPLLMITPRLGFVRVHVWSDKHHQPILCECRECVNVFAILCAAHL